MHCPEGFDLCTQDPAKRNGPGLPSFEKLDCQAMSRDIALYETEPYSGNDVAHAPFSPIAFFPHQIYPSSAVNMLSPRKIRVWLPRWSLMIHSSTHSLALPVIRAHSNLAFDEAPPHSLHASPMTEFSLFFNFPILNRMRSCTTMPCHASRRKELGSKYDCCECIHAMDTMRKQEDRQTTVIMQVETITPLKAHAISIIQHLAPAFRGGPSTHDGANQSTRHPKQGPCKHANA